MKANKISTAMEYISLLMKKYSEQQQVAYRIIDINKTASGHMLQVQVISKAVTFTITPEEAVLDDKMLELFSKKDIRMITYLACIEAAKPKYKIVSQEINLENNIDFKLCEVSTKNEFVLAAKDITRDKDILKKLSPEDIHSTSYAAGYEHAQLERKNIRK